MLDKRAPTAVPFDFYVFCEGAEDVDWYARAWLNGFFCSLAFDRQPLSSISRLTSRDRSARGGRAVFDLCADRPTLLATLA